MTITTERITQLLDELGIFLPDHERGIELVNTLLAEAAIPGILPGAQGWPEDQDEYGRLAAIAQNGNDGLHYQDKTLAKPIPTAEQIRLVDATIQPPPSGAAKLILLSRYGVTTIGTYQKGYHVAWAPMPKVPSSVKVRQHSPFLTGKTPCPNLTMDHEQPDTNSSGPDRSEQGADSTCRS